MNTSDRIERHTEIAASAQTVWELISEPGWFINDGTLVEHRLEDRGDGLTAVHDPVHGTFLIQTEALDPPRYAAFRWIGDEPNGHALQNAPSTLVEFWIEEQADGQVVLRVLESGLDSLPGTEAERRRQVEESTQGWELELSLARAQLERSGQQEAGR